MMFLRSCPLKKKRPITGSSEVGRPLGVRKRGERNGARLVYLGKPRKRGKPEGSCWQCRENVAVYECQQRRELQSAVNEVT